jgi:TonB dependent receptor/Carboxypeptidase regulatory-like domain/TonB-dependent Receptor Plug Domain
MPRPRAFWSVLSCSLLLAAQVSLAQAQEPPPESPRQTPTPMPRVPPPAPGEDGSMGVRGKITDADGYPLMAALVEVVDGGSDSAQTDENGSFTLLLVPGTYTLQISFPLYDTRRVAVTVAPGQAAERALALSLSQSGTEVIEIVGKIDRGSEGAQLQLRKSAAVVSDVLSSAEIARTPDSSASDAVKRLPSVTLEDGKYVLIRGLGDRYVSVLLNGVILPSPEPDRQAVPLDLFPASMLSNLTVLKSYAAELPGIFGGGALRIDTHSYPVDFQLEIKGSTSADTASAFQDIHGQAGGSLDFLGYDDGARRLPAAVPADMPVDLMAPEDQERVAESFANQWTVKDQGAIPNVNLGAELGDTVELGGKRLGYLGSLSFGHKMRAVENQTSKTHVAGEQLELRETLYGVLGVEEAGLSMLGNVGYALAPGHSVNAIAVYTHDGESISSLVSGYSETDAQNVEQTHLQFVERSLTFTQLTGSHRLPGARNLQIAWQGNASVTSREEPDTRDITYNVAGDGGRAFKSQPGSGERFFSTLDQTSLGAGVDLELPLRGVLLRAGATAQRTEREFLGRSFRYRFDNVCGDQAVLMMDPTDMFAPENIGPTDDCSHSFSLLENTTQSDGYAAALDVLGTYAAADVQVIEPLRVIAGARFEYSDQELLSGNRTAMTGEIDQMDRTDPALLPTANVVYALTRDMSLRAGYSYTLARPQFRDLAPFLYADPIERITREGNPDLVETRIHGADLRWEWFPAPLDVIALSGFYKRFRDPIEQIIYNTAGSRTYANAASADVRGAELELRTSLGRVTPLLDQVRVGANLALMSSSIELRPEQQTLLTNRERPLQGQAPYVINMNASYDNPAIAEVTMLYNVIGASITDVGSQNLPDVYTAPFHRLDLVARRKLGDELRLKLTAANLLDAAVERTQGDLSIFRYKPGVSFSLGLEWAP